MIRYHCNMTYNPESPFWVYDTWVWRLIWHQKHCMAVYSTMRQDFTTQKSFHCCTYFIFHWDDWKLKQRQGKVRTLQQLAASQDKHRWNDFKKGFFQAGAAINCKVILEYPQNICSLIGRNLWSRCDVYSETLVVERIGSVEVFFYSIMWAQQTESHSPPL